MEQLKVMVKEYNSAYKYNILFATGNNKVYGQCGDICPTTHIRLKASRLTCVSTMVSIRY